MPEFLSRPQQVAGRARLAWAGLRPEPLPPVLRGSPDGIRSLLPITALEAVALSADATSRAERAWRALSILRGPLAAGWIARSAPVSVDRVAAHAGPVALALPLHERALGAMAALRARTGRPIYALQTPLTEALFGRCAARDGWPQLVDGSSLLALARRGTDGRAVYVTFPDHYLAGTDSRWKTELLGEPYLVTLLEPLLWARGVPVHLLERGGAAWTTRPLHPPPGDGALSAEAIQRVADRVASSLGEVIRSEPAGLFSWAAVQRGTVEEVKNRELRMMSNLRELLRSWHESETGLAAESYRAATELLDDTEAAVRRAPRWIN